MRRGLDALYWLSGTLAMLLMVAIALLVLIQMGSRLFRVVAPGVDDFAGYALVAAAFLALGPSLKAGSHVRVTLIVNRFGPALGRWVDAAAVAFGAMVAAYFAWASLEFVIDSYRFDEIATGMVATPMWLPRLCMPAGLIIMTIAFVDELHGVLFLGRRLHD